MERARLVLIAKGDLLHQEAKLAASGLGDRFSGIELGEGFLILARRRRLARLAAGPSAT
jgi:putative hydrolase of the HAD superfamily